MNEHTSRDDPALASLERRLEALARREREAPDEGFESRTMDRLVRASLAALGEPIPIERSRLWRRSWTGVLAASVAVVAAAMALLWAGAPAPAPVRLAEAEPDAAISEVDEFIETVAWLDEGMPGFVTDEPEPAARSIDDLLDEAEQTLGGEEESI